MPPSFHVFLAEKRPKSTLISASFHVTYLSVVHPLILASSDSPEYMKETYKHFTDIPLQ